MTRLAGFMIGLGVCGATWSLDGFTLLGLVSYITKLSKVVQVLILHA